MPVEKGSCGGLEPCWSKHIYTTIIVEAGTVISNLTAIMVKSSLSYNRDQDTVFVVPLQNNMWNWLHLTGEVRLEILGASE